ncbi:MAG: hypothetical protein WBP13_03020 [Methylophilaceae bacterium]
MNISKRNRLIADLSSKPEPQIVAIEVFFDGNDDPSSIGCNLMEHPGVEAFRSTLARIASREDVEAVYAQICELDPGEDSWPFTDTILVVGSILAEELASELAALEPDQIGQAEAFGIAQEFVSGWSSPVLVAWWD